VPPADLVAARCGNCQPAPRTVATSFAVTGIASDSGRPGAPPKAGGHWRRLRTNAIPFQVSGMLAYVQTGYAEIVVWACSSQTPQMSAPLPDRGSCPSKWAPAMNARRQQSKLQTALNAAKLSRTAEVTELSHPLSARMPLAARRVHDIRASARNDSEQALRREADHRQAGSGPSSTVSPTRPHNVRYNCCKTKKHVTPSRFTKPVIALRLFCTLICRSPGHRENSDTFPATAGS
jgi:hypothetical protein